jgi:HK97 family phage portal protein
MTGNFVSGKALERAADDVDATIRKQSRDGKRQVLTLPAGHTITQIGADPEKSQLVELKRFQIEEIARIYSLPPVFLQDLTHGTIGNTEQQDLHLVKHTIRRWVIQAEQELNLKLFGRDNTEQYVEFNLDGLLRGDFATRMSGYATAVQNAILMPNEIRELENRPENPKGNDLLIQGATVPLGMQTAFAAPKEKTQK